MGWFWASPPSMPPARIENQRPSNPPQSACPVMHNPSEPREKQSCPVRSSDSPFFVAPGSKSTSQPPPPPPPPNTEQSTLSKLNPLNYMFSNISQSRAANQTVDLPIERESSSIPRADGEGSLWEYPSPQQMYNAMLRKGYTDTPQDAVESMVAVHNFLNEGAWGEIEQWERTFGQGLLNGWEKCRRGSENLDMELRREKFMGVETPQPKLVKFMGRPQERTPKASILQMLGWLYPSKFGTPPPFDRHDWYVLRETPSGPKEVRYVIDFYSGEPESTGEPVFYLDIRPALDTPTAAAERLMKWGGDVWWRASGGNARESR